MSINAEAAVLSAVMIDSASLDKVLEFLKPEHFYSEAHRRIFEACMELKREGRLLHEDLAQYTGYHCVHQPMGMAAEALDRKFDEFNRRVYTLPSILRRTFLNPALLRNPWGYVLAGLVNLQYRAHVRRHDIPVVY